MSLANKKENKWKRKFRAAKIGMRVSIWQSIVRKYGNIIDKKFYGFEDPDNRKKSYIRIKFDDGKKRKFTAEQLRMYSSFRLEMSGLDKATWKAKGKSYDELVTGGREPGSDL